MASGPHRAATEGIQLSCHKLAVLELVSTELFTNLWTCNGCFTTVY